MDYIEDDFTDALIDAVCGKLPSTWYTLIGENFDPDEETIVKEADNKKDIEDAFNESKDDFDSLYVVLSLYNHLTLTASLYVLSQRPT